MVTRFEVIRWRAVWAIYRFGRFMGWHSVTRWWCRASGLVAFAEAAEQGRHMERLERFKSQQR